MNPRVIEVKAITDYQLELRFANDEQKVFDVKPYLNIGRFVELRNEAMFQTVRCCMDSIQWQNGLDLCPDMLYEDSVGHNDVAADCDHLTR